VPAQVALGSRATGPVERSPRSPGPAPRLLAEPGGAVTSHSTTQRVSTLELLSRSLDTMLDIPVSAQGALLLYRTHHVLYVPAL